MSSIVPHHRWDTITNHDLINLSLHNLSSTINLYSFTQFSKHGKYVAVLFESRYVDNIEIILKQLSRFLNNEWSVILYVTENVFDPYTELCNRLGNGIQVKHCEYPLSNVIDYNNIMLDLSFWKTLESFSKVLVFQTDTIMYRYGIEQFYIYDYIGAPWPNELGCDHPVGNGGFSIRTTSAMIDCLTNMDKFHIKHYAQYEENMQRLNGKQPEDIIFSQGMYNMGYKLPPVRVAKYFSIETVEQHYECIGSHRIDHFNKPLSNQLLVNSIIPYFMYDKLKITGHRFGWNMVISELHHVFTNPYGIYFDTWTDVNYICNRNRIPNGAPWVGIFHLTPVLYKNYYSNHNIDLLASNKDFINDLQNCKGIFTLSTYMKHYVDYLLLKMGYSHIKTDVLYHPVEFSAELFNPSRIDTINTIISLGSQLRKCTTLYKVNVNYNRIWLSGRTTEWSYIMLREECNEFNISISNEERNRVSIQQLSNEDYDTLLGNSYVIIDLYDASANNALIECIARNIPCFVSRIPAVIDYIGSDYPLLFTELSELEAMLGNKPLIREAYQYLVDHPELKERLTMESFIRDILNSPITKYILNCNSSNTNMILSDDSNEITKYVCKELMRSSEPILFKWKNWIETLEPNEEHKYVEIAIKKGKDIVKILHDKFSRMKFRYGADETYIDITNNVFQTCIELMEINCNSITEMKWCIYIPASYKYRDERFGDPLGGHHKYVIVENGTIISKYDENESILIAIV
jgi:hypothetical protein